jgi:hypothetical protein
MTSPVIKPVKSKEYYIKQSKYPNVGLLPLRTLLLAPSFFRENCVNPKYDIRYI